MKESNLKKKTWFTLNILVKNLKLDICWQTMIGKYTNIYPNTLIYYETVNRGIEKVLINVLKC